MSAPVVTVYTSAACPACAMTKRHLDKRGIAFTEVALDADDATLAAAAELGLRQAPIVCVSTRPLTRRTAEGQPPGEQCWDGYRPDRIDALAGAR